MKRFPEGPDRNSSRFVDGPHQGMITLFTGTQTTKALRMLAFLLVLGRENR